MAAPIRVVSTLFGLAVAFAAIACRSVNEEVAGPSEGGIRSVVQAAVMDVPLPRTTETVSGKTYYVPVKPFIFNGGSTSLSARSEKVYRDPDAVIWFSQGGFGSCSG